MRVRLLLDLADKCEADGHRFVEPQKKCGRQHDRVLGIHCGECWVYGRCWIIGIELQQWLDLQLIGRRCFEVYGDAHAHRLIGVHLVHAQGDHRPGLKAEQVVGRYKVGEPHRVSAPALLDEPDGRREQQQSRIDVEFLVVGEQLHQVVFERLQRNERFALDLRLGVQLVDRSQSLQLSGEISEIAFHQASDQLLAGLLFDLAFVMHFHILNGSRFVQHNLQVKHVRRDEQQTVRVLHELQAQLSGQGFQTLDQAWSRRYADAVLHTVQALLQVGLLDGVEGVALLEHGHSHGLGQLREGFVLNGFGAQSLHQ